MNFPKEIKCFNCKKLFPVPKKGLNLKIQSISKQTFYFLQCINCQIENYFWKNQANKFFINTSKLHVVLYEPEIAGNVGTIIRLAAAFKFSLHLIEPFGFIFSSKWLKRSSTNHFDLADINLYYSWKDFSEKNSEAQFFLTSSKADKYLRHCDFKMIDKPIYLIFGCESKGLPKDLIAKHQNQTFKINQSLDVSSINLANAVSIATFFVKFQYERENIFWIS